MRNSIADPLFHRPCRLGGQNRAAHADPFCVQGLPWRPCASLAVSRVSFGSPLAFPEASQASSGAPKRAQGVLQEGLGEDFGEI